MSVPGQKRKSSVGANVFSSAPNNGHRATTAACPFRAKPGSARADAFRLLLAIVDPQNSHHILTVGLAFGPFPTESNSAVNDKFVASDKGGFIAR
jgi:hypothetical protein